MTNKHIAISTVGDPFSPGTWSGTPYNIIKALQDQKIEITGIDSAIKNPNIHRIYRVINRTLGFGKDDQTVAPLNRIHSARIAENKISSLRANKVLHVGIRDLPFLKFDKAIEHYLFIDSTWDTWIKDSAIPYTQKLIKSAENLERRSYAQIKHFFTTSHYVKANLVDHYKVKPSDISVVGTGRGKIEVLTEEKDYSKKNILFVSKGRFEDKGGFLLIEGFKLAQKIDANIKLVVICQKDYQEIIKSSLRKLHNAVVMSSVSWEQLQELFNEASLFAMPALNEPWGLVYLEALACKVPILGLKRNSLPELTLDGKFGFLATAPTPQSICDQILEAFSDIKKLSLMGTEGQNFCLNNFSWERTADIIISQIFND